MLPAQTMYLVVALTIISGLSYLMSTLRGRTQPNRVTWFLWGFSPLVMYLAQRGQGVGHESLFTLVGAVVPLVVFAASFFNPRSVWRLRPFDLICGAISLVGLVLWLMTRDGLWAFSLALIADIFAGTPTFRKAYSHPQTEHPPAFMLAWVCAVLTLLAADQWSLLAIGFPVWILISNSLLCALTLRPSWFGRRQQAATNTA